MTILRIFEIFCYYDKAEYVFLKIDMTLKIQKSITRIKK